MLKRQQFKDSKNDKTKPKVSKCQHMHVNDNKKEQSLDKYEGVDERNNMGYISLLFVANFFSPKRSSTAQQI